VKRIPILDADIYSHEALSPDTEATKEILKRYGDIVSQKTGRSFSINRLELGNIIFSNAGEKTWLENLLHPIIEKRLNYELEKVKKMHTIGLVIPLLFEADLAYLCSEIWLVYCNTNQQYERLMNRDKLNFSQAKCRIESQLPMKHKKKLADKIIDNSSKIDLFTKQVNKLF